MIEQTILRGWNEFDKAVREMPFRRWLFRGQVDASWELVTSLYRLFTDLHRTFEISRPESRRGFARDRRETAMINQFKANAHLYLKTLPRNSESNLEWLSIMQHFGCPTRLLDVTASPYIALHFALEQGHGDAAVYAFNHGAFRKIDIEIVSADYAQDVLRNKKGSKAFIIPYEPKQTNERLVAQQGAFIVPSNNYEKIDTIMSMYDSDEILVKKLIIPANLRLEDLKKLRRMNITAASLFPGLEGFCRSLRDQTETVSQLKRFEIN
ncbi:MAG: FRG domain-containing protein [Phycisphaerales bacterium]|nr:MAG: FRG domain-containing protein [Phycisphaerales bacterium]